MQTDRRVELASVESGDQLPQSGIAVAFFATDDLLVIAGDYDLRLIRMTLEGDSVSATLLPGRIRHHYFVESAAVASDRQILASVSTDGDLALSRIGVLGKLEILGHPMLRPPASHGGEVLFGGNGSVLVLGENLGGVRVFRPPDFHEDAIEYAGLKPVGSTMAMSSKGHILASATHEGRCLLWSLPEGRLLRTVGDHVASGAPVAVSPMGDLLAATSVNGNLDVYGIHTGELLASVKSCSKTRTLRFSPDGTELVISGESFETGIPELCAWTDLPTGPKT